VPAHFAENHFENTTVHDKGTNEGCIGGSEKRRAAAFGYAIAVAAVGCSWLLRIGIGATVADGWPPYVTFFPAVMVAALLGGLGPGFLATALAVTSAGYVLLPPDSSPGHGAGLILFAAMGALMTVVAEIHRRSHANKTAKQESLFEEACSLSEQLLRESESRYRMIVDQASDALFDGILVADAQGRHLEVNLRGTEKLGYTRDEILTMRFEDFVFAEDLPRLADKFARVANGEVVTSEWRLKRKDGSEFLAAVRASRLADGRQQTVIRDITPHRLAEQAAQESAELLRAHVENSPMAVIGWDEYFTVTRWAGGAEKLFGWKEEEFIGRRLHELHLVHAPDIPLVEQAMERIAAGERYVLSRNRNVTKAGRVIHCVWHNSVLTDATGKMTSVLSQVEDVTEQVTAETALRESEAKFRALFEGTNLGIKLCEVLFDSDGAAVDALIIDCNATYARNVRVVREKIVGRRLTEVIPGIEPTWAKHYGSIVKTGKPTRFDEYSGTFDRWLEVHASPMGGSRVAVVLRDITDQRRAEIALRAAVTEAERANGAKSRFLAATSHDLRQPLSALSLYVGTLASSRGPVDGAVVANMRNCVESLSELLGDLLDLSRLDAGIVKPEISDFRLDALFANIMSSQAPDARQKGLALRLVASNFVARCDAMLLQRIVENFVANAIRYTGRGGVLIGCRRRQGKRWIEVWDTGIGIPDDKTGEIFEEFRQLANPERNRAKGSGLGLAIVARTASLLGLQIRVCSTVGRGSMFAVEVPRGELAPTVVRSAYTHRPLRVALIEDNVHVAAALAYALRDAGHEVVAAASCAEALTSLGAAAPDIVVSDYRLAGGMTGFDAIARIKATFGDELPAFVITGDTDPALIAKMASKGIHVLHKPIDIDILRAQIAELTN
jgi:PAS domain S-box-containing protein